MRRREQRNAKSAAQKTVTQPPQLHPPLQNLQKKVSYVNAPV